MTHVSDLTWDRMLADHLAPARAAEARLHAAGCATCAARGAELEAAHRRFAAAPPRLAAARSRWWVAAPVLAAAAALLVVVRSGEPAGERAKGGFAVTVFAGRAGDAVPLAAGDPIFPGDRLQLTYSAAHPGHLAALAIDGAGQVAVYFPTDRATTWPAAPGHKLALPASTELDGVLGDERLWIVLCAEPQPLEPLVAALAARGLAAEPPAGCEVRRLQLAKRAGPR